MADSSASLKKHLKWTDEQERVLIENVQEKPHIWDIKHPHYINRTLKRCSYEEIVQTLIAKFPENEKLFTVEELVYKFSNLRTQFRRLNTKVKPPSGSGSIGFVPKWKHFYALQFLGDTMEATQSTSNLTTPTQDAAQNLDLDHIDENECPTIELNESIDLDSSNILNSPTDSQLRGKGKKRKRTCSSEVRDFALRTLQELQNKSDDEEEIYGQYITSVLKSFDPIKRGLCKFEFEKIIFKLRHNVDVE